MIRKIRIAVLLLVLASVALGAWRSAERSRSWQHTLHVALYPLNGDGRPATERYLQGLQADDFAAIAEFFAEEAERYELPLQQPLSLHLERQVDTLPPALPDQAGALSAMLWSLQLRYWAWRHSPDPAVPPDIRLYLVFYDPAASDALPHSVGLRQGQIGVAHVFASRAQAGSNTVVIAHELMHTLGATDKYDPASALPVYPDGYAEPERSPRLPQRYAELMGGRIPLSPSEAQIPRSLAHVLVGAQSAAEIGWGEFE